MSFVTPDLDPRLQAAVKRLGFTTPTPIQKEAIPPALEGKDLVGTAKTGTGKTMAFALPLLHRLLNRTPLRGGARPAMRALILAPTRELALQIHQAFQSLLPGLGLRSAAIFGGVGFKPQEDALRQGVEIIVACPGRLLDHIGAGLADLKQVEVLVLDEADQMFDMGFLPPLRRIISRLPHERQTMLFSATFAPELQSLIKEVCRNPLKVNVDKDVPVHTVAHALYPVAQHLKSDLLLKLMEQESEGTILIFTRTKHRANRVAEKLARNGWECGILHSNKSQSQRQKALEGFKSGRLRVLVATDIAARGIDVAGVTHVINFDIPETAVTYIHRIGRTGRAEKNGDAFTLITPEDTATVRDVERTLGKPIERKTMPDFDYHAPPTHQAPEKGVRPIDSRSGGGRGRQGGGGGGRRSGGGRRGGGRSGGGR